MAEHEKKDYSMDGEHLKNETTSAFNEVRETIKNVDLKKDTKEASGFLLAYIKNPLKKIQEIAAAGNTYFKIALAFLLIWTVSVFIDKVYYLIDYNSLSYLFRYGLLDNLLSILLSTITPVLRIIIIAVLVMILNRSAPRSLISLITTVTMAYIPRILASVLGLLSMISYDSYRITSPVAGFCQMLSAVLLYFGLKAAFEAEDDQLFIKSFIRIAALYYAAVFILSFMGISL